MIILLTQNKKFQEESHQKQLAGIFRHPRCNIIELSSEGIPLDNQSNRPFSSNINKLISYELMIFKQSLLIETSFFHNEAAAAPDLIISNHSETKAQKLMDFTNESFLSKNYQCTEISQEPVFPSSMNPVDQVHHISISLNHHKLYQQDDETHREIRRLKYHTQNYLLQLQALLNFSL